LQFYWKGLQGRYTILCWLALYNKGIRRWNQESAYTNKTKDKSMEIIKGILAKMDYYLTSLLILSCMQSML
jgi:hypothetical protein